MDPLPGRLVGRHDPADSRDDVGLGGRGSFQELVGGGDPHDQVGVGELGDQVGDRGAGPIDGRWRRGRGLLGIGASIHDPPDPSARSVSARMGQLHLVVTDDPVVEIGDIEGSIWPQLDVDGAEPVVLAPDEIGLLDPLWRRAVPLDPIAVDPVGDDVADEDRAAVLLGELVGRIVADAGDARRAVVVGDHLGAEAQSVVRLAEAGIPGTAQELIDRPAVAVAGIKVAERVEGESEGVDLPVRDILGVRAVAPEPIRVARVHADCLVVAPLHLRFVGEAVTRVDPAVEAPRECVGHPVSVAMADDAIEHLARVGPAIAVRVLHQVDIGDIVDDRLAARRDRAAARSGYSSRRQRSGSCRLDRRPGSRRGP